MGFYQYKATPSNIRLRLCHKCDAWLVFLFDFLLFLGGLLCLPCVALPKRLQLETSHWGVSHVDRLQHLLRQQSEKSGWVFSDCGRRKGLADSKMNCFILSSLLLWKCNIRFCKTAFSSYKREGSLVCTRLPSRLYSFISPLYLTHKAITNPISHWSTHWPLMPILCHVKLKHI